MSKFTPGPWKAVAYPAGKEIGFATHEIQYGNDGECVAEVVHGEVDARLIAAAPEMLEALKDLLIWANIKDGSPSQHIRDRAKEAIAKATNQKEVEP